MPIDNHLDDDDGPAQRTEGPPLLHVIPWRDATHHSEPENAITRSLSLFLSTSYRILVSKYANFLLVFVPLGLLAGAQRWNSVLTFLLNFLAIISLASILSFATDELSSRGQTTGGILKQLLGKVVELIIGITALRENEIRIVQIFVLGSILFNMLCTLGSCFIAGNIRRSEQQFNSAIASTMSSLMTLSTVSLAIPAALYASLASSRNATDEQLTLLSRGTSLILLVVYMSYLNLQLKNQRSFFDDDELQETLRQRLIPISLWLTGVILIVGMIVVSICAGYLVDSIDSIVTITGISRIFIGIILIPVAGNAAEYVQAVRSAYGNRMDLAIALALGSSLQIALFITPLIVVLGWVMGRDMTLHFETFETIVFFSAALVVFILIQNGESNQVDGFLCVGMYLIMALAFFVMPPEDSGNISKLQ